MASQWQRALDAADRALAHSTDAFTAPQLARRRHALVREREQTSAVLARLARTARVHPAPWLSPVPVTRGMLGLPAASQACFFDLEGVLTDSGRLHAEAWAQVFDGFLLPFSERVGWHFIPFDRDSDYRRYIDGRTRLEGVQAFLASRGIRLPTGTPDDPASVESSFGLARRKSDAFEQALQRRRLTTLPGSRRYLEATGRAGISRAVISASNRTAAMVELSNLTSLLEVRIDAEVINAERLRSRPAPDTLLAACRRLGITPETAVSITHSVGGIAAARTAGLGAIGIADGSYARLLLSAGADRVAPSLDALLDNRLK